jgi:hypothetical protein
MLLEDCNKSALITRYQEFLEMVWPLELGEILTVWEPPKAPSIKLLETECGSRSQKGAVATLIASCKVTSKVDCWRSKWATAERSPKRIYPHGWSVTTKQASVQCALAGLKIESALLWKQDLSLFERIGSERFWESKRHHVGPPNPFTGISELRENSFTYPENRERSSIYH